MNEDSLDNTQIVGGEEATQMVAPGAEATQMAVSVTCPVCGSSTPGGEQYCADCGFLLSSTPAEVAEEPVPAAVAKFVDVSTGREFLLSPGKNTIGREDADVLLTQPTVSRKHAELTIADEKFSLADVGSSNGTYVGEQKVEPGEPVEISSGTEVRFGSVTLRLEAGEEAEGVEGVERVEGAPAAGDEQAVVEAGEAAGPAEETAADVQLVAEEPERAVVGKLVAQVGGEEFAIKEGQNTIGRKAANDIVIADPYASGSHAAINAADGTVTLTDLGSTNGSFVSGEKLNPNEPRELADGDEITVGQSVFQFTVTAEQGSTSDE